MAGLPRSEVSFRRQGSSGSVWDDKFLKELNKMKPEVETDQQTGQEQNGVNDTKKPKESSSSSSQTAYKTTMVPSPSMDPPSPKVSGCGVCGPFAKSEKKTHKRKRAGNKRKS